MSANGGRRSQGRSVPGLIVGVLLLAMAAGQFSDLGGFADVLDGYRLVPEPVLFTVAVLTATAEAVAGVALLRARQWGANLAVAVAVAWSVLTAQAFVRGIPVENCGCFGVYLGQSLRWWVLAQDASFVASAVLARRGTRGPADGAVRRRARSGYRLPLVTPVNEDAGRWTPPPPGPTPASPPTQWSRRDADRGAGRDVASPGAAPVRDGAGGDDRRLLRVAGRQLTSGKWDTAPGPLAEGLAGAGRPQERRRAR